MNHANRSKRRRLEKEKKKISRLTTTSRPPSAPQPSEQSASREQVVAFAIQQCLHLLTVIETAREHVGKLPDEALDDSTRPALEDCAEDMRVMLAELTVEMAAKGHDRLHELINALNDKDAEPEEPVEHPRIVLP